MQIHHQVKHQHLNANACIVAAILSLAISTWDSRWSYILESKKLSP